MLWIYCHPLFDERKFAHRFAYRLSQEFAKQNSNLHRFDYTGTGDDPGSFSKVTWSSLKNNLKNQCKTNTPINLIGLRLGATLALNFSLNNPERVKKLICMEPILDGSGYIDHLFRKQHIKTLLTRPKNKEQKTEQNYINIEGFKTNPALIQSLKSINLTSQSLNNSMFLINNLPPFWERISNIEYQPIIQKIMNNAHI